MSFVQRASLIQHQDKTCPLWWGTPQHPNKQQLSDDNGVNTIDDDSRENKQQVREEDRENDEYHAGTVVDDSHENKHKVTGEDEGAGEYSFDTVVDNLDENKHTVVKMKARMNMVLSMIHIKINTR